MKNKFKDSKNNEWILRLNVGIALKIKDKFDIDLMGDVEKILNQLSEDPALTIEIAWMSINEEQREENKISGFQGFCENLCGDSLESLVNAVLESLVLFIPSRPRKILTIALKEKKAAEKKADKMLTSGELEKLMQKPGE